MVLFALLVIVVARGYPAGLVGICHALGAAAGHTDPRAGAGPHAPEPIRLGLQLTH